MRASVGTSRMKPQSMPSAPSALTHAIVRWDKNESFAPGDSLESRYSGSRRNQGLKVKKSAGLRATDRTATGATRLRAATAAATLTATPVRERNAAAMPRPVRPTALEIVAMRLASITVAASLCCKRRSPSLGSRAMRRRELLGAAIVAALPWRRLRAAADAGWRTFEVTTRAEISRPEGISRAWLPLPLKQDTDWQRAAGNTWTGNARRMEEM